MFYGNYFNSYSLYICFNFFINVIKSFEKNNNKCFFLINMKMINIKKFGVMNNKKINFECYRKYNERIFNC